MGISAYPYLYTESNECQWSGSGLAKPKPNSEWSLANASSPSSLCRLCSADDDVSRREDHSNNARFTARQRSQRATCSLVGKQKRSTRRHLATEFHCPSQRLSSQTSEPEIALALLRSITVLHVSLQASHFLIITTSFRLFWVVPLMEKYLRRVYTNFSSTRTFLNRFGHLLRQTGHSCMWTLCFWNQARWTSSKSRLASCRLNNRLKRMVKIIFCSRRIWCSFRSLFFLFSCPDDSYNFISLTVYS